MSDLKDQIRRKRAASKKLSKAMAILKRCLPYIKSAHQAEHMLDGFSHQKRPVDSLKRELENILSNIQDEGQPEKGASHVE